jgi:glycosyltransferase involved in cell wall biosynthesis
VFFDPRRYYFFIMISFIIPAHNEEAGLGRTLQAINDTARAIGRPYEIVVVNDASTDATPEVALKFQARVISVNHRQIAATRNSGGRAANGDRLFFVDADTTVNRSTLASALRYMDQGAAGGGATVLLDGISPFYIQLIGILSVIPAKLMGFTGGAFMFCTRPAFEATGGFDERLFWAEEGPMGLALKAHGRFIVPWKPVLTSGRRFRQMSAWSLFTSFLRMARSPLKIFTRRSSVAKIWYDSNRANDDKAPNSLVDKISNAVALMLVIAVVCTVISNLLLRREGLFSGTLGKMRLIIDIFLCHLGLMLWPAAVFLLRHLMHRMNWIEWSKLAAIFAFCVWQGLDATMAVIWFWGRVCHRLAI